MTLDTDIIFTTEQQKTTGNVLPLLHEIRHALDTLVDEKKPTIIDLRRIPLSADDEEKLETFLGTGEVRAEISALGPTVLQETLYSGVWIETHYNEHDEVMGKFITIATAPHILLAQDSDMEAGLTRLTHDLDTPLPSTGGSSPDDPPVEQR
ncbi:hydrogenase expression/formation protein [Dasania sp. GY-MA-18]|uniref:Hydrogenase expression/formation protein n=1 Tax=Dasania phycosphaerae TaxID=2950436 RepID=A0A9J6RNR5_9GAMM|nr:MULTISPECIES: hydrogenase expression/formation protein [Dasania]MCR8923392.1 hydrogenase expression/formation protein [Dasania sp. GY-MA-18]MCZ0865824.1 hydrogenase expression/formation protein [Dasania phycosphaerae]MCZ0869549.1 hydrogenase expression/formation protein [Dasania phycosphaerae]